jgi:hypothetical protein
VSGAPDGIWVCPFCGSVAFNKAVYGPGLGVKANEWRCFGCGQYMTEEVMLHGLGGEKRPHEYGGNVDPSKPPPDLGKLIWRSRDIAMPEPGQRILFFDSSQVYSGALINGYFTDGEGLWRGEEVSYWALLPVSRQA